MTDRDPVLRKLDEIDASIKRLITVVGLIGREEADKIKALSKSGMSSFEIERVLGIPAPTVRWMLSKKQGKPKREPPTR